MIDYEIDCKAVFAAKLHEDMAGKGRIESAAYHTARHIYLLGVRDGIEAARISGETPDIDPAALREVVSFR